jgi:hypothetical protein
LKGSTAITGRSEAGAVRRSSASASAGGGTTMGSELSPAGASSVPMKRNPLRAMVRISFWSRPVSPIALRAA